MKVGRIVGSLVVARIAWGAIARRRAALARERRSRKFALLVVAAGASGAWAARRRIGAIALRLWEKGKPTRQAEPQPVHQVTPQPVDQVTPQPSAKKRQRRARRTKAELREKSARIGARRPGEGRDQRDARAASPDRRVDQALATGRRDGDGAARVESGAPGFPAVERIVARQTGQKRPNREIKWPRSPKSRS